MLASKALAAAVSQEPAYIEDVFSTWLYTGNGSTQTITNGIDLAGKGGLVWLKGRSFASSNFLFDTQRGVNNYILSNLANAANTATNNLTAFSSTGFSLDQSGGQNVNNNSETFVSWTFREQPKFFDVVTYTGNGSNRTIAHNLGSVPGCIIVKRTDTSADWQVYHRSLANTEYMVLNSTAAKATGATRWNSTTPTSTEFSLGTDTTVNASGGTYVAYIFAHDAGGFGLSGSDNVISCGTFTSDATPSAVTVSLGWEPQFLLITGSTNTSNWEMVDTARGLINTAGVGSKPLYPNLSNAEAVGGSSYQITSTGLQIASTSLYPSTTYIYIAIRRGPMKVPTSGTEVFSPLAYTGTGGPRSITSIGWPTDSLLSIRRDGSGGLGWGWWDRLRGTNGSSNRTLVLPSTGAEQTGGQADIASFDQLGVTYGDSVGWGFTNTSALAYIEYFLRRAPGFFDVVCYTGTGATRTVAHNLAAVPELMIVKRRSGASSWIVYANNDNTDYLVLETTAATVDSNTVWNDTSPTSSVFTVGTDGAVNFNTSTYVAYLFATVAGVSKVGSYTGTGTTQVINCGFTAGARFVLIKRTDSTGDWYVWDTARGIVAGNDPYLLLNSTAAEVTSTDYVDTASTGFEISSTAPAAINASGGTFIFLAIA